MPIIYEHQILQADNIIGRSKNGRKVYSRQLAPGRYSGSISKCNDDWIVLTEYGILTIPFMRDDYMELV